MRALLAVAFDLLREARSRKWFLGLFAAVSLTLLGLSLFLRLEVVDGALSASRLFGSLLSADAQPADVALRPVFLTVAFLGYVLGAVFLVVACADFAPGLLSPGRIEQLLSLPVARWQLLCGTYLGLLSLAALAGGYGALGVVVLFGVKTGVWEWRLLWSAAFGVECFAVLAAAMLATATVVRSAAVSAGAALVLFVLGAIASAQKPIGEAIETPALRTLFGLAVAPLPRLGTLCIFACQVLEDRALDGRAALRLSAGALVFAFALLAFAVHRFERKDF
ncbi:MAG: ABC transporter permease subunit [Myxococcaceae bacterium]|nr:ABC transporter permease subunit [Myxococcaceae bacterium]